MVMILALSLFTATATLQEDDRSDRGLVCYEPGTYDGYTLVAPLQSDLVVLLDMEGEVAHQWKVDWGGDGGNYLLADGELLRSGLEPDNPRFDAGGVGGRIQKYGWNGERTWLYRLSDDTRCHHHDVEALPNGHLLAIAWEYCSRENAIAGGRDPEHVGERGLWCDMLLELKPTGPESAEIVWEWHSTDRWIQDADPALQRYGSPFDHPERIDVNADHRDRPPMSEAQMAAQSALEEQMRALGYLANDENTEDAAAGDAPAASERRAPRENPDWMHTNAVAYHPGLDLIVLSVPRWNEIWVIDHSTTTEEAASSAGGRFGHGGDLLYRWGNPRNYGHGGEEEQRLFFQHNPTWLDRGDGLRVLLFNNNGGEPDSEGRRNSCVLELELPFDPSSGFRKEENEASGPDEPSWSYFADRDHSSSFISGCQRLPNGNTLICAGAPGRIFEVTSAGDIVWDYRNPLGQRREGESGGGAPPTAVFRALRFAYDDPRIQEIR